MAAYGWQQFEFVADIEHLGFNIVYIECTNKIESQGYAGDHLLSETGFAFRVT